jgi:hypothetical protein
VRQIVGIPWRAAAFTARKVSVVVPDRDEATNIGDPSWINTPSGNCRISEAGTAFARRPVTCWNADAAVIER